MSADESDQTEYAGQRLGFPPEGRGSVASWLRRVVALFIDWFASRLAAYAILLPFGSVNAFDRELVVMSVFILELTLLTALMGGSFGQLLTRITVVHLDGSRPSILSALVRTVLICLVIPPVVFNPDNRGLHDLAVGTIVLQR